MTIHFIIAAILTAVLTVILHGDIMARLGTALIVSAAYVAFVLKARKFRA